MPRKPLLTAVSLALCLGAVLVGAFLLRDRSYYLISGVILLLACLPFAALFRRRHGKVRELVIVSVMAALAVASRAAFYMLPTVKPLCAIAIITGLYLGEEVGCMVGVLSMFLSNFLFGQGAWTPYQIFGMGFAAFAAALILRSLHLQDKRLPCAIVGGLCCFLLYGLCADSCAVFAMAPDLTWRSVSAILLSGLPFNASHGAVTGIVLFFLCRPIGEKLERLCTKYRLFYAAEDETIQTEGEPA